MDRECGGSSGRIVDHDKPPLVAGDFGDRGRQSHIRNLARMNVIDLPAATGSGRHRRLRHEEAGSRVARLLQDRSPCRSAVSAIGGEPPPVPRASGIAEIVQTDPARTIGTWVAVCVYGQAADEHNRPVGKPVRPLLRIGRILRVPGNDDGSAQVQRAGLSCSRRAQRKYAGNCRRRPDPKALLS
jgi:hypothetical protein